MGAMENTARFANVAVDEPVDAAYTYAVPEGMRAVLTVGSRVKVPLGRGNRLTTGTVLELFAELPPSLQQRCEPPASAAGVSNPDEDAQLFDDDFPKTESAGGGAIGPKGGIKPIAEVMQGVLPIPSDLLDLAKWISTYYVAPIGMTIASMVPAAVKRGVRLPVKVTVRLSDDAQNASPDEALRQAQEKLGKKISPRARATFEKLHPFLGGEEKPEEDALSHADISRPALKRLADSGLLVLRREIELPDHAPTGAREMQNAKIKTQNADAKTRSSKLETSEPINPPSSVLSTQSSRLTLTTEQNTAMDEIGRLLEPAAGGGGGAGGFAVRLIHGVTGSGKTELYIRAIEKVVARGQRAIVLVPEISLTPQTARRFKERFSRVAVLHSGLKDSERHLHWHAVATGWAQVIVGARSAIFAPATNVGLIVVDEEHDSSYKQDSLPKYHGRDVAIRRAQMLNIPILLGSATPALESWHNAHHHPHWGGGSDQSFRPPIRHGDAPRRHRRYEGRIQSPPRTAHSFHAARSPPSPDARKKAAGHLSPEPPRLRALPHVPALRMGAHVRELRRHDGGAPTKRRRGDTATRRHGEGTTRYSKLKTRAPPFSVRSTQHSALSTRRRA